MPSGCASPSKLDQLAAAAAAAAAAVAAAPAEVLTAERGMQDAMAPEPATLKPKPGLILVLQMSSNQPKTRRTAHCSGEAAHGPRGVSGV